MESAIRSHLQCPRSCQRRKSVHCDPPYPAWTARLTKTPTQITMACLGVQCMNGQENTALATVAALGQRMTRKHPAALHDIARDTDDAGHPTWMAMDC